MAESAARIRLSLLGEKAFSRNAHQAERSLRGVGRGGTVAASRLERTTVASTKTGASMNRLAASGRRAAGAMRGVGASAATAAAPLARAGAAMTAVGLGASIAQTVKFDAAMRNVNSIAQLSEQRFGSLSKSVLTLAGPTAQAPETLAKGLYDLVSSGFNAQQSMQILEKSARAATAGLTTTEVSTGAVAAVLNAYRLPASAAGKVSDQLFKTVDRGVVSFESLATTVGDVLPFAASLGIGLDQVGASVATMTKAGISAPETMTRIKSVMQSMLKPGKTLTKTIKDLGYESGETLIKQKGFQGALETLAAATGGSKTKLAALFPNVRALGGALALTGKNTTVARGDLQGMTTASGATSTALSQQSKSISFQWNRLKAQSAALGISVGTKLVPALSGVVAQLSDIAAGRGAIGGFSRDLIGGLAGTPVAKSRAPFADGVATPPPKASDANKLGGTLRAVGDGALALAKGALPVLRDASRQMLDALKPAAPFLNNVLLPLLKGVTAGVIGTVVGAFKLAVPIIKLFATAIGLVGSIMRPFRGVITGVGVALGVVFSGGILRVLSLLPKVGKVFSLARAPIRLVTAAVRRGASAVGALGRAFSRGVTFVGRFASGMTGGARRVILAATNMVQGVIHKFVTLPGRIAEHASRLVKDLASKLSGAAGSVASAAGKIGKAVVDGIVDAIKAAPGEITSAITSVVPGPVKGAVNKALGLGKSLIPGIATGGVVTRKGVALVGERGPELVQLPGGARVNPADQSRGMLAQRAASPPTTRARQRAAATVVNVYPRIIVQQDRRGTWRAVLDVERDMAERE